MDKTAVRQEDVLKCELPASRVREVLRLDADMREMMVKKDALDALTLAAQMFVAVLTEEAVKGAKRASRLEYADVVDAVQTIPAFHFATDFLLPKQDATDLLALFEKNADAGEDCAEQSVRENGEDSALMDHICAGEHGDRTLNDLREGSRLEALKEARELAAEADPAASDREYHMLDE